MINIQDEYRGLLSGILYGGKPKEDRTGTGTRSVFGRIIRHNMSAGFPLLTTKRIYFNHAVTELFWMLQGRTDLHYLHTNGVRYWDNNYKKSGRKDGTLGPVYGHQWRSFNGVDQITRLIRDIRKCPHSRRLMVSCWNPSDLPNMVLPPCHYNFQIYINDGKLDLMWQQRSVDVFLGLPYDIAIYALLLQLLCKNTNYVAGELTGPFWYCHLYNNHIDQSKEQLSRSFRELPNVIINNGIRIHKRKGRQELELPSHKDIKLEGYNPHPPIKAELSI